MQSVRYPHLPAVHRARRGRVLPDTAHRRLPALPSGTFVGLLPLAGRRVSSPGPTVHSASKGCQYQRPWILEPLARWNAQIRSARIPGVGTSAAMIFAVEVFAISMQVASGSFRAPGAPIPIRASIITSACSNREHNASRSSRHWNG